MAHRAGKALGEGGEALDLLPREARVGLVRSGEMAHQADHAVGGHPLELLGRHAPAAHACVDLEVERKPFRELGADTVTSRRASRARRSSPGASGPMTTMRALGCARAELLALLHGRHAERGGAGLERRPGAIEGSVAVRVGLDDGPELRGGRRLGQADDVPAQRAEIDRDLGSPHDCAHDSYSESTDESAPITSLAIMPA